jgi:hypothetical protein
MNRDTYALIGAAYAEVEAREPWADNVRPVARIGLVSAESNQSFARGHTTVSPADEGAARMLLETHLPFLVLDENARWDGFDLIVLPDTLVLTPNMTRKAGKFLAAGGRLLAAGSALLNAEKTAFAIDPGAKLLGRSPSDPDYLVATALTPDVPVRSPIVIHGGAYEVKPAAKTRVLIERRVPYFNRTWEHFCSHQHAPDAPAKASPAATLNGNIAWFAHDIFTRYRQYGQPLYRDFVVAAIDQLLAGKRPVTTTLPTDGRFNLMEQRREKRFVAHLLYAPKSLRGASNPQGVNKSMEVIEDLIPLRDVNVRFRVPRKVKTARLVPEGEALPFTQKDGMVSFTVPGFTAHAMVELGY